MDTSTIQFCFKDKFKVEAALVVRAPGRINLIGEHTDYNLGFVLPAAIDKAIYFAIGLRDDNQVHLYAENLNEDCLVNLLELKKTNKRWANFLIGVIKEMRDTGADLSKGFNVAFGGDVPLGAGLSSSAAVESGMGFALNELFHLGYNPLELALIAQKAEHNFAGVNCGIMDMYASIFGRKDHLIKLDCRALTHQYLPFKLKDYQLVLFNTGVKHSLADSAYNERRQECEKGVSILQKHFSEVKSLRDTTLSQLESLKNEFPEIVFRRCHYVISETERMMRATKALERRDLEAFGLLMYETHDGLSKEYEVSCKELDFLVDQVKASDKVAGARMMGGGFGGCTINLVKNEHLDAVIIALKELYKAQFGIELEHYLVQIENGCECVFEA